MALGFIDPTMAPYVATFLFVFGAVFGLLSYAKIGDFGKKVNAVIALAFALFAIYYEPFVKGMQAFLPIAIIILMALFFILFLKKIFDKEKEDTLPLMVAIAIMLVVFMVAGDKIIAGFVPAGFDVNTILWIIGLIAVILFFWAAYSHKEGGSAPAAR